MCRLRITFVKDGEIQCHKDSQHANYAIARKYWRDNVACSPDYALFGAFWRGRKCLALKVH